MKHILIFFALLFCSASYGQIQDWNIKIRSGQDTDSTYVLLSDTTGQFAGRGRWYSLAILADLIEGYISSGAADNWGTDVVNHDNTLTGNGTVATPLKVDSTKIATQYDISGFLSAEVDGSVSNEGSMTVEAGGATTSEIHSNTSGSTDVTLNAAWGLDISENTGTGNITYIADSSEVATQYDLTQITGTADHDFYESGTTTPPNANTDNMFNDGALAIGNDGPYIANGLTLHAGFDAPHLRFYGASSPEYSWSFNIGDDGGFILYNVSNGGAAVFPFKAEDGATVNSQLLLQADGDVQISDYPNSRDDGTPTNVLGTDINGVIQSYPVADVQPTTEAIQDIVGAMFTGNTETNVTVDYQDADGTIDVVVSASGSSTPYVITPAQLTSDQDNYAPTGIGIATYIYIDSDNGMRAITGIADSTAGTLEKTIINDGSYMIYLPMSHPDSDAAHRFVGWPGDYYIYPGHSVKILYDLVANNWRILGGDLGYTKPTLYYTESAGSTTTGDFGTLGIATGASGTVGASASTTTFPARWNLNTANSAGSYAILYHSKGTVTYSAFGSGHQFVEHVMSIPTLSDAGNSYTYELQLCPSPTSSTLEDNNLVGVRYNHGINSGKFELFTQDNGGSESTPADLGVTVAVNTLYRIRIEFDKSRSEARAYINNVYCGRIATNMPNAVAMGSRSISFRNAGTPPAVYIHTLSCGAIYPY